MLSFVQGGCLAGCVLLTTASLVSWYRQRPRLAIGLLMAGAFLLRLLMASLDPFLHDWDEQFHALVAKNMIAHPFAPMLRADPVLPYEYTMWCCNHIWLHKQPLFLWQMALSMKLFGVGELTMRLPSALLGSLVLYPIYRLGCLIFDENTGYLGALLAAFAFYQLEQTSGAIGMDHNDVAFGVYVTSSLWAYYEYRHSARPWRWLVLVGLFAGSAVLCKWLTGLVVYAGWGLDTLLRTPRRWAEYGRIAASTAVAVVVFLPWQLYTAWRFPAESAYERAYNSRHFTEAIEGHAHEWYYHFDMMRIHYGAILWLIGLGIIWVLVYYRQRPLIPLLSMVVIVFVFFTLAATKMYSYTYITSPLLLLLAAVPLTLGLQWVRARSGRLAPALVAAGLLAVILADARPWGSIAYHFQEQIYGLWHTPVTWSRRAAHADLYRHLDEAVPEGYVVFNAPQGGEISAMFYSNRNVYSWWPSEEELRKLQARGRQIALFPDHHDQHPPEYLRQAPGAITIWALPE